MEKDTEITENTVGKQLEPYQFKKGQSGNPNGRPKGSKNFDTIFDEALKRIAAANSKEPDEFDIDIVAKGLEMARKGDYKFWKDLLDRRFGKAMERHELSNPDGNLKSITIIKTDGWSDKTTS